MGILPVGPDDELMAMIFVDDSEMCGVSVGIEDVVLKVCDGNENVVWMVDNLEISSYCWFLQGFFFCSLSYCLVDLLFRIGGVSSQFWTAVSSDTFTSRWVLPVRASLVGAPLAY